MVFKKKIKIIKEEPQSKDKYDLITDGIGKLKQGDKSALHIVYNGLGYGDRNLNQLIGSTISERKN